jgi:(2Fe-2S) ferredoxin
MAAGSDTRLAHAPTVGFSKDSISRAAPLDVREAAFQNMPPYLRHVFVCTNRRPEDNPKGSCAAKGSEAVLDRFKEELHKRGLKGRMRANAAGCLDACAFGTAVVVYPEGVWYAGVKVEDVVEIIESHLVAGAPVERLRMRGTDSPKAPAGP